MLFPDITRSGPVFIEFIPGIFSMPFIPLISPGEGVAVGMGMFIFCSGGPCGFREAVGMGMPGMFMVCGEAEGDAVGICMPGIFIWGCGEAEGDAVGTCMPGMFIGICPGEGWGAGDCAGDDEGLAGIFIPSILLMSVLFAGFFFVGAFLLRPPGLRRGVPGIFIPGMLLMSCFFRATFFFALDLGFGFDLLIPGIFDISCCARTGNSATNKKHAKTSDHTFMLKRKLIAFTFFIIPT